jgi:hypothetical protein
MAKVVPPFAFNQCSILLKATGKKAKDLKELRNLLSVVSDRSIYHHTYQYFIKGNILEYTNDFAQWAGESLEERELAEYLSNIDLYTFTDIDKLRKAIIHIIDQYLKTFPDPREVIAGDELYFNESITLVFPLGIYARNLAEFLIGIKHIDPGSIYYHFYEARTRLGSGIDDFSMWTEYALKKKDFAMKIRGIDPFMHTIEEIRQHIIEAVEEEVKTDMETLRR